MTDVEQTLRRFVANNFVLSGAEFELKGDDSLTELGLIDSTGVLELVAFLEGQFNVEVGDADLIPENLDSIDSMVAFLSRRGAVLK